MPQSIADHVWNSLTFSTSLFSLFGKDWAQRCPVVKWAWPRAWDEWEAEKHKATDDSPDVEGVPMTELTDLLERAKDFLTQAEMIQSRLADREEKLRAREEKCAAREERLLMEEADREREGQVLTKLETVADRQKASEEVLSTCHDRCINQDRATRRFLSNAQRIMDREDH